MLAGGTVAATGSLVPIALGVPVFLGLFWRAWHFGNGSGLSSHVALIELTAHELRLPDRVVAWEHILEIEWTRHGVSWTADEFGGSVHDLSISHEQLLELREGTERMMAAVDRGQRDRAGERALTQLRGVSSSD